MKASKFWITATAAVATAGTIGLAIAQQVNPQQPAAEGTAAQSLSNPGSGTDATGNAARNSGSTSTNIGSTDSAMSSGSSSAASTNTVAQADRN